uniref:Uncharacterized protein n=1 Tax=Arundo donax TaxID=35708 RepID=A0A0A9B711_ARUDO
MPLGIADVEGRSMKILTQRVPQRVLTLLPLLPPEIFINTPLSSKAC